MDTSTGLDSPAINIVQFRYLVELYRLLRMFEKYQKKRSKQFWPQCDSLMSVTRRCVLGSEIT